MFRLTMETDNAAFADDGAHLEVARILRVAAAQIEEFGIPDMDAVALRDTNGNVVGDYELTETAD